MSTRRASERIYRGVWGVLVGWLRVPDQPPEMPAHTSDEVRTFRPAEGFLKRLKFLFWLLLWPMDIAILVVWLVLLKEHPTAAAIAALPALALAVVPDVIAYIAIHVRYDTTWCVMTDRSIRIRRGVWVIHETTITFENVQNVKVTQGPLQRWFGIADVAIQTAGGGGGAPHGHGGGGHQGLIEGRDNAAEVRDLILAAMRRSKSAGLGDEREAKHAGFGEAHTGALREIRDELRAAVAAA